MSTIIQIPSPSGVSTVQADSNTALTGAVTLVSGTNITLSQSGQNITITGSGTPSLSLTNAHLFVGNGSNVATDVALTGDISITNAGVSAIASGVIINSDINTSAAIAYSKLAALTVSRALVSDGSGVVSVATTTATEIGYVNGVTSAIQTQLGTKVDTAGRGTSISSTTVKVTPSSQTATASDGNVTPTSDTKDTVIVTVDANFTVLAPSGTPVSGQKLLFRLDNDGSHAATFDTGGAGKFRFGATIASYAATASKSDYIGAVYNSTASRWDIVSASLGF